MDTKQKKLWGKLILAALVIIIVTYRLWLPGWTITRLAEIASTWKLGHKTEMSLFQDHGNNNYSIYSLKVYNNRRFTDLPLFKFQNIFLTNQKSEDHTLTYDSVECCCGDLYIITFPDGTTNFSNFPIRLPRNIIFNNIRIHVNTSELIKANELVIILDGYVKRNPDNSLKDISLKILTRDGQTLANIITNRDYIPGSNNSATACPYLIKDFSFSKIMGLKDSAAIFQHYPSFINLLSRINNPATESK